jgi:ketosteroid isomerase-like protein
MSENLDLVRLIYADWERGDFSSVGWAHAELEYVFADSPGTWTGLPGLADSTRDFMGAWENFRIEADEYRELDDERVLVLLHFGGRGKASGLEIGQAQSQGASLFHVGHGKVRRIVNYWDRDRALADLGLKE